MTKHIAWTR